MNRLTSNHSKQIASLMAILFALVSFTSTAGMISMGGVDGASSVHDGHRVHQLDDEATNHCEMGELTASSHVKMCEKSSHHDHEPTSCQLLCAIACTPSLPSLSSIATNGRPFVGTVHNLMTQALLSTLIRPPFKPPRQFT